MLTTHYLEEAQALCQRIAMLRSGTVIALDTTRALLSHIEGVQMTLRVRGTVPPSVLAHRIDERDGALVLRLGEPGDVGPRSGRVSSSGLRKSKTWRLGAPISRTYSCN